MDQCLITTVALVTVPTKMVWRILVVTLVKKFKELTLIWDGMQTLTNLNRYFY
jgi:hypothetical protein